MKCLFAVLLICAAVYAAAQTPASQPAPGPAASRSDDKPLIPPKQVSREELLKASAVLEESIRKAPEDADLRVKLGFTYVHLLKIDDAQREFETAVRLNPKKAIAHYMLGLIYEKKGLKAQAIASLKTCLDNTQDPRLRGKALLHLHRLSPTGAL